jgi:hypothetical protein
MKGSTEPYSYISIDDEEGNVRMHAASRLLECDGDDGEYTITQRCRCHFFVCCTFLSNAARACTGRMRDLRAALACVMGLTFACVAFFVAWGMVTTSLLSQSASMPSSSPPKASGSAAAADGYYAGTFDSERVEEAIARLVARFILNATAGQQ